MSNVLVVGDLHAPFTRKGYLEHCKRVRDREKCETVVLIGDVIDNHAASYHEHSPDGHSHGEEMERAIKEVAKWHRAFPKARICIGNHDELVTRKAITHGISNKWIRSYNEVLGTNGWDWGYHHELDGVLFQHGTGLSGPGAPRSAILKQRRSVVFGHIHSAPGISYHASSRDLIFGMNVGCGVDIDAFAFAYGRFFQDKPVISCGTVKNGVPALHPMQLGVRYPAK